MSEKERLTRRVSQLESDAAELRTLVQKGATGAFGRPGGASGDAAAGGTGGRSDGGGGGGDGGGGSAADKTPDLMGVGSMGSIGMQGSVVQLEKLGLALSQREAEAASAAERLRQVEEVRDALTSEVLELGKRNQDLSKAASKAATMERKASAFKKKVRGCLGAWVPGCLCVWVHGCLGA